MLKSTFLSVLCLKLCTFANYKYTNHNKKYDKEAFFPYSRLDVRGGTRAIADIVQQG